MVRVGARQVPSVGGGGESAAKGAEKEATRACCGRQSSSSSSSSRAVGDANARTAHKHSLGPPLPRRARHVAVVLMSPAKECRMSCFIRGARPPAKVAATGSGLEFSKCSNAEATVRRSNVATSDV